MTEFKAGDRARVKITACPGPGETGVVGHVKDELVFLRLDDSEYSGWYYPGELEPLPKKTKQTVIRWMKVIRDGEKCYQITGFENVLGEAELPHAYCVSGPLYLKTREGGICLYLPRVQKFEHPIPGQSAIFIEMVEVGDVISEETLNVIITWMQRAGARLAKIRRKEREAWNGEGETVI